MNKMYERATEIVQKSEHGRTWSAGTLSKIFQCGKSKDKIYRRGPGHKEESCIVLNLSNSISKIISFIGSETSEKIQGERYCK